MYVCVCKGITESQILSAIENGASSIREVRDSLGVMTQCGKCACYTRDLVRNAKDSSSGTLFYPA